MSVRPVRWGDERGSALVVILALTGILSLLVGASFILARQSLRVADAEEEVNGALAAAEAGLDDYLFRLNAVDAYWTYGAAADGLPPPPDGNLAFEGFVPLPGGPSAAEYTYAVDTSRLATEGVLVVESTGRAQGRERTIAATITQDSFLDYVYFTDLETLVPFAYRTPADVAWAEANCSTRRWEAERPTTGRPSDPSRGCTEIFWFSGDVVDGPFHTNDRFRLGGNAEWRDRATGSDPTDPRYDANGYVATFAVPGDPAYRAPLVMPPSNTYLKVQADERTAGAGCLFTGPTSLVLQADGTIEVTSPLTRDSGPGCGTWSDAVDPTQTIPIPANGVIYVQNVPADPSDPNHTATCPTPGGNGLGYPYGDDVWAYDCLAGDAFVEGTLDGRLTIGAQNDVIVTWHTEHEGTDDMLGLIANDYVAIYHPITCTSTASDGSCSGWGNANAGPRRPTERFTNPRVDAAVLSVNGSFLVQSWDNRRNGGGPCTPLGTLTLTGAIAQTYRGPVGTFSGLSPCTGYLKDYRYDDRLVYANPPSFIDPVDAQWRVLRVAEQFS